MSSMSRSWLCVWKIEQLFLTSIIIYTWFYYFTSCTDVHCANVTARDSHCWSRHLTSNETIKPMRLWVVCVSKYHKAEVQHCRLFTSNLAMLSLASCYFCYYTLLQAFFHLQGVKSQCHLRPGITTAAFPALTDIFEEDLALTIFFFRSVSQNTAFVNGATVVCNESRRLSESNNPNIVCFCPSQPESVSLQKSTC